MLAVRECKCEQTSFVQCFDKIFNIPYPSLLGNRLFAAGIEKCPEHVSLYQAWACLELKHGNVITAKRLIGEALTRNKRNGSGWLVAAKIEEKMGNNGLVGLILRRGIECAPDDTELYRALAEHEIKRGKIDSVSCLSAALATTNCCHFRLDSHSTSLRCITL